MTDQPTPQLVTLSTLSDGAAEELFQAALSQLLENVQDPNTDAKAKRSILLRIDVRADENRRAAQLDIACATKLAGVRPVGTRIFLGRHQGSVAAVEQLHQEEIFPKPAGGPRPVEVAKGGE